MNYKRIVLGGLAAGSLMIVLDMVGQGALGVGQQWQDALVALGKPMHLTGGLMAMFFINYFLRGLMLVFIYAAIRPRFGAGPTTAVRAALGFWIAMAVFPAIVNLSFGLFPVRTVATMGIEALVEMIAGTLLGGWLYKEEAASQSRAVAAS
jgi:xanthosine utilization system XapX-like protein